jgi:hypothetical protein
MTQLTFWNNFYDVLEPGWWYLNFLNKIIREDSTSSYVIYSEKAKIAICGFCSNENNKQKIYFVDDTIFGDGNQLHITRNIK